MSFCEICQEEINADSQYINGYWYHNNCIEHLQEENDKALTDLVHESHKRIELENKITNLQEELKSASESITWWQNRFNALHKENEKLKNEKQEYKDMFNLMAKFRDKALTREWDYKSKNEKAIDKIQHIIDYGFDYDGFNTLESLKGLIDMLVDYARQSKDILQGSDKDEL